MCCGAWGAGAAWRTHLLTRRCQWRSDRTGTPRKRCAARCRAWSKALLPWRHGLRRGAPVRASTPRPPPESHSMGILHDRAAAEWGLARRMVRSARHASQRGCAAEPRRRHLLAAVRRGGEAWGAETAMPARRGRGLRRWGEVGRSDLCPNAKGKAADASDAMAYSRLCAPAGGCRGRRVGRAVHLVRFSLAKSQLTRSHHAAGGSGSVRPELGEERVRGRRRKALGLRARAHP